MIYREHTMYQILNRTTIIPKVIHKLLWERTYCSPCSVEYVHTRTCLIRAVRDRRVPGSRNLHGSEYSVKNMPKN